MRDGLASKVFMKLRGCLETNATWKQPHGSMTTLMGLRIMWVPAGSKVKLALAIAAAEQQAVPKPIPTAPSEKLIPALRSKVH